MLAPVPPGTKEQITVLLLMLMPFHGAVPAAQSGSTGSSRTAHPYVRLQGLLCLPHSLKSMEAIPEDQLWSNTKRAGQGVSYRLMLPIVTKKQTRAESPEL